MVPGGDEVLDGRLAPALSRFCEAIRQSEQLRADELFHPSIIFPARCHSDDELFCVVWFRSRLISFVPFSSVVLYMAFDIPLFPVARGRLGSRLLSEDSSWTIRTVRVWKTGEWRFLSSIDLDVDDCLNLYGTYYDLIDHSSWRVFVEHRCTGVSILRSAIYPIPYLIRTGATMIRTFLSGTSVRVRGLCHVRVVLSCFSLYNLPLLSPSPLPPLVVFSSTLL